MKTIKKLRSRLLELLTHQFALPLITRFRNNKPFPYTMEQLLQLPDHTLGKDLALYLQKMNFKLLRNYERHDCKHIILQYEMNELGEARMQFYFLGNRHYSLPVLSTVIICFVLMPEHWSKFLFEFKKGRNNPSMDDVNVFDLIEMNTAEIRTKLCLSNCHCERGTTEAISHRNYN